MTTNQWTEFYVCEHCGKIKVKYEMACITWDRHIREKKKNEFSLEERHEDYRIVCDECVKLHKDELFK